MEFQTTGPIDRTPGTPGSDKNDFLLNFSESHTNPQIYDSMNLRVRKIWKYPQIMDFRSMGPDVSQVSADLTDVTLVDEDNISIPTPDAKRSILDNALLCLKSE